jgi:hypothetical protein
MVTSPSEAGTFSARVGSTFMHRASDIQSQASISRRLRSIASSVACSA